MMDKPINQKLDKIEKTQGQILFYVRILAEVYHAGKFVLPEVWLDDQEVMQRMHWSKSTLKRRLSDGTIPYKKIKNKCYYREQDVYNLLFP